MDSPRHATGSSSPELQAPARRSAGRRRATGGGGSGSPGRRQAPRRRATNQRSLLIRRFAGFASLPFLSLMGSFLLLPLIAHRASAGMWGAIAVGQSVGSLSAAFIAYGWTLAGPARAARAMPEDLKDLYAESMWVRLSVIVFALPVQAVAVYFIAPHGHFLIAVMMSLSMASSSLGPGWFAIGVGMPRIVAIYDTIPKLVAVGISGVAISMGAPVPIYPGLLLLSSVLGYSAFWVWLRGLAVKMGVPSTYRRRGLREALQADWDYMVTVVSASFYASATAALVATAATTAELAQYSSADKLYRIGLFAVASSTSALQGWVASATGDVARRRMRLALSFHLVLGLVGGLAITVAMPIATRMLFGAHLAAPWTVGVWFGVAFAAIALNSAAGNNVLVPMGFSKVVTASTLIGAVAGVPSIVVLTHLFGAEGGAAGLALSEVVVTGYQLSVLARRTDVLRRR